MEISPGLAEELKGSIELNPHRTDLPRLDEEARSNFRCVHGTNLGASFVMKKCMIPAHLPLALNKIEVSA